MAQRSKNGKSADASIEPLESRRLLSTYFVDALTGSDANSGRSPATPWQSFAPVNAHAFKRGDTVLLSGQFTGQSLIFGPATTGVTVNSYVYNAARRKVIVGATVAAALTRVTGDGITISASNVTIENLTIAADPAVLASGAYNDGIHLLNAGAEELTHETINNVAVSGFSYSGLCMQGWNTTAADSAGFSDVLIENSSFVGNQVSGLFVAAGNTTGNNFQPDFPATLYLNSKLTIRNCSAFNNAGYNAAYDDSPNSTNPNDGDYTSGGIFLSSVSNAIVENCTAYNNCFAATGSVGIWAFDSTRVDFQNDESYDNKTAGSQDGDGFDFDHGVTDSIMQQNYSHGNDGAGFLLTTNGGSSNNNGDTIRFCVSDADGQSNGDSGMNIGSVAGVPILNANIYNNTVLASQTAISLSDSGTTSNVVNILNNIFFTSSGGTSLEESGPSNTVQIEGNDYWVTDPAETFAVSYNGTTYHSISAFAAASGQESYKTAVIAQSQDPLFKAKAVSDLPKASESNLSLSTTSPLRREGLSLTARQWAGSVPYNADAPYNLAGKAWGGLGVRDFFGHLINRHGIGAG